MCKLQGQDSPSSKECSPMKNGINSGTSEGKSFADLCVISPLFTVPQCPTCKARCKGSLVLGNTCA